MLVMLLAFTVSVVAATRHTTKALNNFVVLHSSPVHQFPIPFVREVQMAEFHQRRLPFSAILDRQHEFIHVSLLAAESGDVVEDFNGVAGKHWEAVFVIQSERGGTMVVRGHF